MSILSMQSVPLVKRLGATHLRFREVQEYLIRYGYLTPRKFAWGTLDLATSEALVLFQRSNEIEEDGFFLSATRKKMGAPRCAMVDVFSGSPSEPAIVPTLCAWELDEPRRLTYRLLPAFPSFPPGDEVREAVRLAAKAWSDLVGFPIEALNPSDASAAQIEVGWTQSGLSGLIELGEVASSEFPPRCSLLRLNPRDPRPIRFSSDVNWAFGVREESYDIQYIALHEFGHAIGLGHPGALSGSVMDPYFRKRDPKRLHPKDESAAKDLYRVP